MKSYFSSESPRQPSSNRHGFRDAGLEPPAHNLLSVRRVIILSILSSGVYLFWWFYITWKQYRDHSGEIAYPIWHSLTLLVPIYHCFRVYAHMRTYRDLMTERRLANSISPATVVAIFIALDVLVSATFVDVVFGEISRALAMWLLVEAAVFTATITWLLMSVQMNINRYWIAVLPRISYCRISKGEVAITIVGILLWLDTFATAFIDSWRTL